MYKKAALVSLKNVSVPEDMKIIQHSQDVGKLVSEVKTKTMTVMHQQCESLWCNKPLFQIVYKRDGKGVELQGYKKIMLKDDYTLRHKNQIKDINSEV